MKGKLMLADRGVAVNTYREIGFQPIPKVFLNDEEYGRGLQRFVPVCTDIVIIDPKQRRVYLARRRSKPMTGWFWFGSGMMTNETRLDAAVRCFKRETGIELSPQALTLRGVFDYLWKDRQQAPQKMGCHTLGYTFSVELPTEQIQKIKLEENEFKADAGLTAFSRSDLVREDVFPVILDLYDAVFPPIQPPAFGRMIFAHDDDRRTIWELNGDSFSIQRFLVKKSDLPLGKHAHANKFEVFTVLEGGGQVLTCAVDPAEDGSPSEIIRTELSEDSVIHVPPYVAHTFYLEPGSRMHCFSSSPFDQADFIACPFLVN